jgi:hypothetical protein
MFAILVGAYIETVMARTFTRYAAGTRPKLRRHRPPARDIAPRRAPAAWR